MVQLAYLAWSSAAALFEDFARMGLTTASAIERAYKKDTKLLWRIVACFSRVECHAADLWGKLSHAVSYSEHFQPYFKRWRVGLAHNHCMSTLITNEQTHQGVAMVEANKQYIDKNGYNGSLFDEFIVKMMTSAGGTPMALFDGLSKRLVFMIVTT